MKILKIALAVFVLLMSINEFGKAKNEREFGFFLFWFIIGLGTLSHLSDMLFN